MYIDPDGRFSSKFSAQWHRFWHGGDEPILKNDKGQWYYRHISTQRESANSVSVSITDVYGKNGYHGKGGNHENSSSRKSSSSSGLSGYGMFGNARESLIDWGKPKHFYGYIDIAPLLYPVSNPSSKAETVYETAKKIDFFVDQTLKNGVAIEDIPKISNPDLEHPIEVEYNIDKWIQDPDDKNCKTSVMVKDTAYTQKQLDSIRNVAKKKLLPHTKIYENEAIIYK